MMSKWHALLVIRLYLMSIRKQADRSQRRLDVPSNRPHGHCVRCLFSETCCTMQKHNVLYCLCEDDSFWEENTCCPGLRLELGLD